MNIIPRPNMNDEEMDAYDMHMQLEDSQTHISNLLDMLALENYAEESAQASRIISGMGNMLGQFSDNHYDVQNEMNEMLESSRRGLLTHSQLQELVSAEATRSQHLVGILHSLKFQIENMYDALSDIKPDPTLDDSAQHEMTKASTSLTQKVDLMMKSVTSMDRIAAIPARKLHSAIATIDSEVVMHVNKTKLESKEMKGPPKPRSSAIMPGKSSRPPSAQTMPRRSTTNNGGGGSGAQGEGKVVETVSIGVGDNSVFEGGKPPPDFNAGRFGAKTRNSYAQTDVTGTSGVLGRRASYGTTISTVGDTAAAAAVTASEADAAFTAPATSLDEGSVGAGDPSETHTPLVEEHEDEEHHDLQDEHGARPHRKKGHKKAAGPGATATHKKTVHHSTPAKAHVKGIHGDGDHGSARHGARVGHGHGHGGHHAPSSHGDGRADLSLATRRAELEAEVLANMEVEVKRRVKLALAAAATRDYDTFSAALGSKSPMSRGSFAVFATGSVGSVSSLGLGVTPTTDGDDAAKHGEDAADAGTRASTADDAGNGDATTTEPAPVAVPVLKKQGTAKKEVSFKLVGGTDDQEPTSGQSDGVVVDTPAPAARVPTPLDSEASRGSTPIITDESEGTTIKICIDPTNGTMFALSSGKQVEFVDPSGRPVNLSQAPHMFASGGQRAWILPYAALAGRYVPQPGGVAASGDAEEQGGDRSDSWFVPGAGQDYLGADDSAVRRSNSSDYHAAKVIDAAYPQARAGQFIRFSPDQSGTPVTTPQQLQSKQLKQPPIDYRYLVQPHLHPYQLQYQQGSAGQQPMPNQPGAPADGQLPTVGASADPFFPQMLDAGGMPVPYGYDPRTQQYVLQNGLPFGSGHTAIGGVPGPSEVAASAAQSPSPSNKHGRGRKGGEFSGSAGVGGGSSTTGRLRSAGQMTDDTSDAEAMEYQRFAATQVRAEQEKRTAAGLPANTPNRVDMFNQIFQAVSDPKKIEMIRIHGPETAKRVHKGTNTTTDSSVPVDPTIKDAVLTGEGLLPVAQASTIADISGSDIALPSPVPPGHPPVSAQTSRPSSEPRPPPRRLTEAELKSIQEALSKALDAETCDYFLNELRHILKRGQGIAANANASTTGGASGHELPVYDNQGGFLLTRTYRNPTPPATFIEILSSSDNPLLYLHQEYAAFLSKQQRVRLLNAAVLEDRVKNDLPQSKSAQLLMGKLLETMLLTVTECNDMMLLLRDCEERVQQVVELLKRKPEHLQTVLASPHLKELFAAFGDIEATKVSVDLTLTEFRAFIERINAQSMYELDHLMRESTDFEYAYKHFLACQGKSVEAGQRLEMLRERCVRHNLGNGRDRRKKKKTKIEFDDQTSVGTGAPEACVQEIETLRAEVERLNEQLTECKEEFEDQEVEMLELMQDRDRSPDALLFFAIMHDPAYMQNLQQLVLQVKQLCGFADGSGHMDFITLRKRLQVLCVLMPSIEKLCERYALMYQKWSGFRLNWFSARKLNGGSADAFNSCPLCFQCVGADGGSAASAPPVGVIGTGTKKGVNLAVTGMDHRSYRKHEREQKQTKQLRISRTQLLGPGGVEDMSTITSPGQARSKSHTALPSIRL